MSAALEVGTLAECEAVIERGLATFVDVGNALLAIRDGRMYRNSHTTFDEYCRDRWSMDRTRAHRMIAAAEVTSMLPIGNKPATESQARELVGLEPDDAAEVMRHAEVIGGGNITAVTIREARRELHDPAPVEPADEADPYGPDLPNGEYSDLASIVDDLEDDDPALTEEECRALADPADLDDDGPMPSEDDLVEALERRSPGVKADLARADLRAKYSRSLTGVTGLFVLGPGRVAAVLSDTEVGVLEGNARELTRWVEKVAAAKRPTGLTLVNGGRQ